MGKRNTVGLYVASAVLASSCLGLAVPATSAPVFQTEKVMVWQRGPGDAQVLDVSSLAASMWRHRGG